MVGWGTGGALGSRAPRSRSHSNRVSFSARSSRGRPAELKQQAQTATAAHRPPPSPTHLNRIVGDHTSDEVVETGGPDGHKRSLHRAGSRFGITGADVT